MLYFLLLFTIIEDHLQEQAGTLVMLCWLTTIGPENAIVLENDSLYEATLYSDLSPLCPSVR